MQKGTKQGLFLFLFFSLLISIAYAVTLTANATKRVYSPSIALGAVCLWDEQTQACTDKIGEILFGNVNVESTGGDTVGLIMIQVGGNLYRSTTMRVMELSSLDRLTGNLSLLQPDGTERIDIGKTKTGGDPNFPTKVSIENTRNPITGEQNPPEKIPVGEYTIQYDGLKVEDNETSHFVMTGGKYKDLEITFYAPDGHKEKYKLASIERLTDFEWIPQGG